MKFLAGYKTIFTNLAVALITALLTWVVGFDWNGAGVSPSIAIILVSVANIALRLVTHKPVFNIE